MKKCKCKNHTLYPACLLDLPSPLCNTKLLFCVTHMLNNERLKCLISSSGPVCVCVCVGPSGCSSECQPNRRIVYWCEPLTNLQSVNPDLLFDDMNSNNEVNWQIEPERKFTALAAAAVWCHNRFATGGKPRLYASRTSICYEAASSLYCCIPLCTDCGCKLRWLCFARWKIKSLDKSY